MALSSRLRRLLNRRYFPDYMNRSTIHGVSYIVQTDRPLVERVLWLCVVTVSFCVGATNIRSSYERWQTKPVIVTMDDRPTSVQEIPFPAMTICPKTKFKLSVVNIESILANVHNGTEDAQHSHHWAAIVNAIPLVCNALEQRYVDPEALLDFIDFDVLALIKQMAPTFGDFFKSCVVLGGVHDDCRSFFREVFTKVGMCYTFNGLLPDQLYRENTYIHTISIR